MARWRARPPHRPAPRGGRQTRPERTPPQQAQPLGRIGEPEEIAEARARRQTPEWKQCIQPARRSRGHWLSGRARPPDTPLLVHGKREPRVGRSRNGPGAADHVSRGQSRNSCQSSGRPSLSGASRCQARPAAGHALVGGCRTRPSSARATVRAPSRYWRSVWHAGQTRLTQSWACTPVVSSRTAFARSTSRNASVA